MTLYSQRDLRWANKFLGKSKLTVGRYGCTTSSICMLADYFGQHIDPGMYASDPKHYDSSGLILWTAINIKGMRFVNRLRYEQPLQKVNTDAIERAMKDPNQAVILQVNDGQHWVVGIRKTLLGNDYVIADPWTGKLSTAKGMYHNITGAAFFARA